MAQFTNQAQLAYNNSVTNSNIAVGEILEVLSATKTAVQNTYGANDSVTYVISIINSGNTAYNGITVTDNLGAGTGSAQTAPLTYEEDTLQYYVDGILQPTPSVLTTSPLSVSGINVPAGGNATIIYEAKTNSFTPPVADAEVTNTAQISGTGFATFTADATVTAENTPALTIAKSISPVPVTENGLLTYTFVIQNTGNTAADETANIIVTDVFNPTLSDLTVTLNGTVLTENTDYTYDETTGVFTTDAGKITVPAATFMQDESSGAWITTPGTSTLVISGTV